jgi:hypothetical protein
MSQMKIKIRSVYHNNYISSAAERKLKTYTKEIQSIITNEKKTRA